MGLELGIKFQIFKQTPRRSPSSCKIAQFIRSNAFAPAVGCTLLLILYPCILPFFSGAHLAVTVTLLLRCCSCLFMPMRQFLLLSFLFLQVEIQGQREICLLWTLLLSSFASSSHLALVLSTYFFQPIIFHLLPPLLLLLFSLFFLSFLPLCSPFCSPTNISLFYFLL